MGRVHLAGSFGTVREAIDADFVYFGQTIRLNPDASDLYQVKLMELLQSVDLGSIDFDDPSSWTREQANAIQGATSSVLEAMKGQIHPDDWDLFLKTANANRQQTMDLMALSQQLTEAVAGFPTVQSDDSSAGPSNIQPKSKAGSSSPATGRALTLLKGRPDLQAAVMNAEEARRAG